MSEFQMDSVFESIEWYSAPLVDLDVVDGVTSKTYGQADDPSPYYEDQLEVINAARTCVEEAIARDRPDQPAVIFDIDDTTLSSFWLTELQGFGFDRWLQNSMYLYSADPAIEPTLEWFNELIEQGVQPVLITGRSETVTVTSPIDGSTSSLAVGPATIENLRRAGFDPGGPGNPDDDAYLVFFRPRDHSDGVAAFKSATRAQLTEQFDLVGNVGDQVSDLTDATGAVTPAIECSYKLPNPYYFIPGGAPAD
ncbi:MAG: HAD family acid phosphatase [Actinomycetota bacterium]